MRLKGLNKEETNILLLQLSKTANKDISNILKNQSSRIETIRRLTSGIPRTMVLLFEIFSDDSANIFEDLELILDKVTPLYKHRMDDLATKQQAIMDTIALNWDGMTSKEIVQGLKKRGYDTKSVSSLLKVLEKNDLVLSKNIDKKNKIYMLKERFFNIWYLMRYGKKKNKTQVQWLIRFLEEWCDESELKTRARNHIKYAREGKLHPKGGLYMGEALACAIKDDILQDEILRETKNALNKNGNDMGNSMSLSDIELGKKYDEAYLDKNYKLALKHLKKIQNKNGLVYFRMGLLYETEYKDFDNAIKYYKMAIEKENSGAMNNLAYLYFGQNIKKSESLKLIIKSVDIEKEYGNLHSISLIFLWNDKYQESISSIRDFISNFPHIDYIDDMIEYFIFLMAKKQYHLAYNLFEEFEELKMQFKPIYYVLMGFLKDGYIKEYLKQGDELEETIKEILIKIEQVSNKYN